MSESGAASIDSHWYRLGYEYANKTVGFQLEADADCLHVIYEGKKVREFEIHGLYRCTIPLMDYLRKMLEETRNIKDEKTVKYSK